MPTSFLLRFQEKCLSDDPPGVLCGTQTETRVAQEGKDSDPRRSGHSALPATESGTATKTGVAKETSDLDYAYSTFQALPGEKAAAGTKTFTAVHAEDVDEDNLQPSFHAVPRSTLSRNEGTMTSTAVKAETSDADHDRRRPLLAIPPCS